MSDFDDVVLEAEVITAAAGVHHWVPGWFLELSAAHDALGVLPGHAPCLDDGPICSASGLPYPCSEVRALGERSAFTADVAATWDQDWPGWRANTCIPSPGDQT